MDPRDEYEFYDEWLNRDDDESSIGLEEYQSICDALKNMERTIILMKMMIQMINITTEYSSKYKFLF